MKIKTKLHASQLYIPQDWLGKLSLGKESEIFLELDEANQMLIVSRIQGEKKSKEWILEATANPPPPAAGNEKEDQEEYDYEDI